ncbi:hypothetical protein LSM04_001578 [Trypanosoma melophagium]|uniref:uncharacterized protein n=1 Tax=Trypanosoma melophagium TaxID=715481 RepID=UPI003519EC6F|nr:hypothetical protein LSM04_001578 [Trypanosoma melophagium]
MPNRTQRGNVRHVVFGAKKAVTALCAVIPIPAPRPHKVASIISSHVSSYVSFAGAEAAVTEATSQLRKDKKTFPLIASQKDTPKVKCSYCGVWVTPSSVCYLCRTKA